MDAQALYDDRHYFLTPVLNNLGCLLPLRGRRLSWDADHVLMQTGHTQHAAV